MRAITVAAALCTVLGRAHAHAPQPRRVASTPDGTAVALSLPGFGVLYRAGADQAFVYVCDALLGFPPSDFVPPLSFLTDGSLLTASAGGVRLVEPNGCPRTDVVSALSDAPVIALAVRPGAPETTYAVAGGDKAGLWRSSDGGQHWELRSALSESEAVSSIVVAGDEPETVYLTKPNPTGATLLASTDAGATLTEYPQDLALTLLSAAGPVPYPLWAVARDALAVGNRVAILRAEGPAGPWEWTLRVNYFGGLVVDPDGVIWVGDEIGGVYRSEDGGETYSNLATEADVACLAYAGETLWAGTPGTPQQPARQQLAAGESLTDVVAFAQVDALVDCADRDVGRVCAAAWAEWERDVLLRPPPAQDAGEPPSSDAGRSQPEPSDAGDAGLRASPMQASANHRGPGERDRTARSPLPPSAQTARSPYRCSSGFRSLSACCSCGDGHRVDARHATPTQAPGLDRTARRGSVSAPVDANRFSDDRRLFVRDGLGGAGREIVREIKVCPLCLAGPDG